MGSLLDVALSYRKEYGWSVIPIKAGTKKPLVNWMTYQTVLPSEQEIRGWWSANPDAGIGIVTGKTSGVVVVDVDGEEGEKSLAKLSLPVTREATSGKGRHFYFRHAGRAVQTRAGVWPGIDIRGDGGYIVAPPTLHPSGRQYAWKNGASMASFPNMGLTEEKTSPAPSSVIAEPKEWIHTLLKGVGEGKRHDALVRLATYFIEKLAFPVAKELLVEWNRRNTPPLLANELEFTIEDVYKRIKIGLYSRPTPQGIEIYTPANNVAEFSAWLDRQTSAPEFPTGIQFVDEFAKVTRGQLFTILARSSLGKSTITVNFARSFVKAGKKVLFLSTEMPYQEVWTRFICGELNIPSFKVFNHQLTTEENAQFQAYVEGAFRTIPLVVNHQTHINMAFIEAIYSAVKPDVIIFDYFQHIETVADNRANALSAFIKQLNSFTLRENVAFIVTAQAHKRVGERGLVLKTTDVDVKECKSLYDTSVRFFVLNEVEAETEQKEKGDKGLIEVSVAKNRHGPVGKFLLELDRTIPTFRNVGQA